MTWQSSRRNGCASKPSRAAAIFYIMAAPIGADFSLPRAVAAEHVAGNGANAFTPEQRAAFGQLVKEYLLSNPEVLIAAQSVLEARHEKIQTDRFKTLIRENAKSIYRNPNDAAAGDPNGDITIVEFSDYNCPYCRRGLPQVQDLIKNDKRIRLVFNELPILSKGSDETARGALAAKRQGKHWEFHQAMLAIKGQADEATSLKVAERLGLDVAKFKSDAASKDVDIEIEEMKALARKIGINGTPHYLVGDKSISGAPQDLSKQLNALIAEFRKTGCDIC